MKRWKGIPGLVGIAVLVMAGVGVACGGEEEKKAEGPEDYAQVFCDAFGKHAEDFGALVQKMEGFQDIEDIEALREVLSDMAPLFEDLAEDLGEIDPPKDIEQLHQDVVSAFSTGGEVAREFEQLLEKPMGEVVEEMEEFAQRSEAFGEAFDALGSFPPEYQAAFESEPKCQEIKELMP
ncbi:MAG: hypothetical protein WBF66_11620 [Dehalococcoidia bacterium]